MRRSILKAHSEIGILSDFLVVAFAFFGWYADNEFGRLQDALKMEYLELSPNKSLQATRDGALSSADAGHVVNPAWLSLGR